jgi:hypothetical protein
MRSWEGINLIVAGHGGNGPKLQTFCEMHDSDRNLAHCDLDLIAQFDCWKTRLFDGVPRPAKLACRADEDTDLVRLNSLFDPAYYPPTNRLGLLLWVIESLDLRGRAVEH